MHLLLAIGPLQVLGHKRILENGGEKTQHAFQGHGGVEKGPPSYGHLSVTLGI